MDKWFPIIKAPALLLSRCIWKTKLLQNDGIFWNLCQIFPCTQFMRSWHLCELFSSVKLFLQCSVPSLLAFLFISKPLISNALCSATISEMGKRKGTLLENEKIDPVLKHIKVKIFFFLLLLFSLDRSFCITAFWLSQTHIYISSMFGSWKYILYLRNIWIKVNEGDYPLISSTYSK